MEVREVDLSSDYIELVIWWSQHKWTPMPKDMLPGTGFIVPGFAAGFLYKTDCKIAMLEMVVANPKTDKEERSKALDLVIAKLIETAKEQGFKALFTSLNHPRLVERYATHGFQPTDLNVTNMIRSL